MRAILVAIWMVTGAIGAHADDWRARRFTNGKVAWHAPSGCPSADAVQHLIEGRLTAGDLVDGITVDVTRTSGGFVARVDLHRLTDDVKPRTLTDPKCEALADAVALVIALAANERFAPEQLGNGTAHPPVVDAPSTVAAATTVATAPAMARATDAGEAPPLAPAPAHPERIPGATIDEPVLERWSLAAHFVGLSGVGGVPEVGLGGELAIRGRLAHGFGELSYARWVSSLTGTVDQTGTARDAADLAAVSLRGGWSPELPIRAWVVAEAGTMTGRMVDGEATWLAFGAGFGVAWPISPYVRLIGSIETVVPVSRPDFSWPVASRAAFGVEVGLR